MRPWLALLTLSACQAAGVSAPLPTENGVSFVIFETEAGLELSAVFLPEESDRRILGLQQRAWLFSTERETLGQSLYIAELDERTPLEVSLLEPVGECTSVRVDESIVSIAFPESGQIHALQADGAWAPIPKDRREALWTDDIRTTKRPHFRAARTADAACADFEGHLEPFGTTGEVLARDEVVGGTSRQGQESAWFDLGFLMEISRDEVIALAPNVIYRFQRGRPFRDEPSHRLLMEEAVRDHPELDGLQFHKLRRAGDSVVVTLENRENEQPRYAVVELLLDPIIALGRTATISAHIKEPTFGDDRIYAYNGIGQILSGPVFGPYEILPIDRSADVRVVGETGDAAAPHYTINEAYAGSLPEIWLGDLFRRRFETFAFPTARRVRSVAWGHDEQGLVGHVASEAAIYEIRPGKPVRERHLVLDDRHSKGQCVSEFCGDTEVGVTDLATMATIEQSAGDLAFVYISTCDPPVIVRKSGCAVMDETDEIRRLAPDGLVVQGSRIWYAGERKILSYDIVP